MQKVSLVVPVITEKKSAETYWWNGIVPYEYEYDCIACGLRLKEKTKTGTIIPHPYFPATARRSGWQEKTSVQQPRRVVDTTFV